MCADPFTTLFGNNPCPCLPIKFHLGRGKRFRILRCPIRAIHNCTLIFKGHWQLHPRLFFFETFFRDFCLSRLFVFIAVLFAFWDSYFWWQFYYFVAHSKRSLKMLSLTTMRLIVIITILLSSLCEAILPRYLPVVQQNNLQRDDLTQRYFHLGLQQWEILVFLSMVICAKVFKLTITTLNVLWRNFHLCV